MGLLTSEINKWGSWWRLGETRCWKWCKWPGWGHCWRSPAKWRRYKARAAHGTSCSECSKCESQRRAASRWERPLEEKHAHNTHVHTQTGRDWAWTGKLNIKQICRPHQSGCLAVFTNHLICVNGQMSHSYSSPRDALFHLRGKLAAWAVLNSLKHKSLPQAKWKWSQEDLDQSALRQGSWALA